MKVIQDDRRRVKGHVDHVDSNKNSRESSKCSHHVISMESSEKRGISRDSVRVFSRSRVDNEKLINSRDRDEDGHGSVVVDDVERIINKLDVMKSCE